MRCTVRGPWPRGCPSCSPLVFAALVSATLVAGCGHSPRYAYPGSYVGASAVAPPPQQARVEMEDDGMPMQVPPRADIRKVPDDPREPWSPNYGSASAAPVKRADADRYDQPVGRPAEWAPSVAPPVKASAVSPVSWSPVNRYR